MVGYLKNEKKNLNEWYQLFLQKLHTISTADHKNWQYIKNLKLSNLEKNHWKYFPFEEITKYNFSHIKNTTLDVSQYQQLILPIESYRLVFINGQFSKILSDTIITPWIVKIDKNIHQYSMFNPIQPNIFSYFPKFLNNITTNITLPTGTITKKPLYLLYLNEGSNVENTLITAHYHHHIKIEKNADTSIIEHFININENKHFSEIRTSIKVEDHAKLHHVKLIFKNRFSYHIAQQDINVGYHSHVDSNVFVILGPKFTYHQTNAQLNYSQSSVSLNSLTILSNTDINNICTYLEHNNKEYASSRQLHKIIACDHSMGVFNGLIKVHPDSIKTDGKMMNNNLLLHKNATIHSTPKLEIYSDNVQCSHGTTIGQINIDHLFYLVTRGISKQDAIKILIYAFAAEIIEKIQHAALKNVLLTRIEKTLTQDLYDNISDRKN